MSTTTDVRSDADMTASTGTVGTYAPSTPPTGTARVSAAAQQARGRVLEARPGLVIFQPKGTNYELHLAAEDFGGPVDKPVSGAIRVVARKIYTVPSGGNFIAPILGTPRTIQGRVLSVADDQIVIQAGGVVTVDLPGEVHAVDLGNGPINVGSLVNVVALPGARFEPA